MAALSLLIDELWNRVYECEHFYNAQTGRWDKVRSKFRIFGDDITLIDDNGKQIFTVNQQSIREINENMKNGDIVNGIGCDIIHTDSGQRFGFRTMYINSDTSTIILELIINPNNILKFISEN